MAYNFLNTTTYDGEQEGLFNYIANAALTNAGASLSMPDNAEPDLVEITHDDYSAPQSDNSSEEQPDIEEQSNTSDDEFFKEPDEKVDLDLLSSLFDTSEEDNNTLKQQVQDLQDKAKVPNRTYHVEDDNSGEDDNSHTYLPNGKVAPRIWQYGGEPSKYQVGGTADMPLYKPKDTRIIKIVDSRQKDPVTGKSITDRNRRSVNVNEDTIKSIITEAKADGIDPYTALAVSYQESGFANGDKLYNLNPEVFGKSFGNAHEGMKSFQNMMEWAKGLQNRGKIPKGEEYLLQGNNGYGIIKRGHEDLEGANSIYGIPIPDEGINFKQHPYYGKTIISLRDDILKKNPDIMSLIEKPTMQDGGVLYADDRQTQRVGLNDSDYSEAHFSTSGTNTFRGLDNYQSVYVTDGSKYRILKGPNDTDTFKGKVYEKRLK